CERLGSKMREPSLRDFVSRPVIAVHEQRMHSAKADKRIIKPARPSPIRQTKAPPLPATLRHRRSCIRQKPHARLLSTETHSPYSRITAQWMRVDASL